MSNTPNSFFQIPENEFSSSSIEQITSLENDVIYEKVESKTFDKTDEFLLDAYRIIDEQNIDKSSTKKPEQAVYTSARITRCFEIAKDIGAYRDIHIENLKQNTNSLNRSNRLKLIRNKVRPLFLDKSSSNYDSALEIERELKTKEGEIGATIFGPLEPNESRSFFNDNHSSWFFYQEKTDLIGKKHSITFHYEVRPEGVVRIHNKAGMKCELIVGEELKNFIDATEIYYETVMDKVYNRKINKNDTKINHNNSTKHNDQIAA